MTWLIETSWQWLHLAGGGFVLLGLGGLAARLCRQPVERVRIIEWTFCGCLLMPLLMALDILPAFRLGLFPEPAAQAHAIPESPASHFAVSQAEFPAGVRTNRPEDLGEVEREASPALPAADVTNSSAEVSSASDAIPAAVSATDSSEEQPGAFSFALFWPVGLLAAYAAGVFVLLFRLGRGFLLRSRLWREARPAPGELVSLFRELAEAGRRDRGKLPGRVRLAVSPYLSSPVTWGLFRPVILVPETWLAESSTQLRCGLAHEWSHIERRDIWSHYLSVLVELGFFYQPAYWWLKRTLHLSQDQLADSRAIAEADSPADYAQLLVSLVRRERVPVPGAMGILSHKSRLFWRIRIMLSTTQPLERRCPRPLSALVIASAIVLSLGLSAVNLTSAPAEETPTAEKAPEKAEPPKPGAKTDLKPYTYKGQVVDHITQKPIEGVEVLIDLSLTRDPKTREGKKIELRKITANTDAEGRYEFTLTGEEHAQSALYIEVDARHRGYSPKGRSGYAHSMIQKNLRLGDPPFFAKIQLWPGEPIEGTVVDPAGKPLSDVEILTYAISDKAEGRFPRGAFGRAKTDKAGRFRIVVPTPGDGVLWITPKDYCPEAHRIRDKRGDWGQFTMVEGASVQGKVLDARGNSVPNVRLDVRRDGDGEQADQFLGQNAVANHIGRIGTTDANGAFQLASLPAGDYGVRVRTVDDSGQPLPEAPVFIEKSFTIPEDRKTVDLEVQAVPHIVIRGKMLNSKGKPTSGHEFHIFGRMNGSFFFGRSNDPGIDGRMEARVPHGLEKVRFNLMTNEHGVLRWRLSPDEPLKNGRDITMDRLEEDLTTLEIVRYVAPILMVKAIDADGKAVPDARPKLLYEKDSPKSPNSRFISGINGDVNFDKQPDGRWRSNHLYPDQKFTLTIEKEGWETMPQTLSVEEAAEKEVVFILKKKAE